MNVIRLPTAAPKKVRQQWSRTTAADRKSLLRFPEPRPRPSFHESTITDAREMMAADKAAAMQIALAVFSILPDNDRFKVMGRLAGLALRKHAGTSGALAWINYEMSSSQRRQEIFDAAKWLQDTGEI